jgi:hypothetical protein
MVEIWISNLWKSNIYLKNKISLTVVSKGGQIDALSIRQGRQAARQDGSSQGHYQK